MKQKMTPERAIKILKASLRRCAESAEQALSGEWDRGDDGFEAIRDDCRAVLARTEMGEK